MFGINYEYLNKQNGAVVVFLHGWGLNGNSFDKIISKLNDVSIVKFDLHGFGNSKAPKDYFDTYEYAYQIFLCLKKLKVNKVVFVGHSFGGRLSILLSSVFKIDVVGCVLISSAGINRFEFCKWFKIRLYKMLKKLCSLGIVSNKYLLKFGSRDFSNANSILRKILVRVVNQDLRFFAKQISCKTVLVWDKKDKDTKLYICKKLHRYIKLSNIFYTKNGGHFTLFYNTNKISYYIKLLT